MRRLSLHRDDESAISRKPEPFDAPSELVAATAAAARYVGAALDYAALLLDCGAALAVPAVDDGFVHSAALPVQSRGLADALRLWGFPQASVSHAPDDPVAAVRGEIAADRPAAVAGCFPEAPWRAGLVVHLGRDGLWTVMDCRGRFHRMAPRAAVLATLGPPTAHRQPPLPQRLGLWTAAAGQARRGWLRWLELLRREELPATAAAAHEYLYEVLLDCRSHAAAAVAGAAELSEGIRADWLAVCASRLDKLVAHLEARRPPVHAPEVYDAFADRAFRGAIADHMAGAAELDMLARRALTNAAVAEYPPQEAL